MQSHLLAIQQRDSALESISARGQINQTLLSFMGFNSHRFFNKGLIF